MFAARKQKSSGPGRDREVVFRRIRRPRRDPRHGCVRGRGGHVGRPLRHGQVPQRALPVRAPPGAAGHAGRAATGQARRTGPGTHHREGEKKAPAAQTGAGAGKRAVPASTATRGLGGILSEARLGLLAHDEGPFSSNKEDGADINVELLFVSPHILDAILSPRPHIGFSANTSGDTNQAYLGLTWEWKFWRRAFVDFSLGGAVHDGKLTTNRPGRTKKELGCRTLFRLSADIGYNFSGPHSLMAHLGHISNASLCDRNEGLESAGVRYGYRF